MERHVSPRCVGPALATRQLGHLSPLGGEVPRLVAVQGEIDADGK